MTPEQFITRGKDNKLTERAGAHGWTDSTPEMPVEEIQRRLRAMNLERVQQ